MKRKVFAWLCMLTMLFSLTACSSETKETTAAAEETTAAQEEETTAAAEETTEAEETTAAAEETTEAETQAAAEPQAADNTPPADPLGTYYVIATDEGDGTVVGTDFLVLMEEEGVLLQLDLSGDGKAVLTSYGEEIALDWDEAGFTADGLTVPYYWENGNLVMENEGQKMIFSRMKPTEAIAAGAAIESVGDVFGESDLGDLTDTGDEALTANIVTEREFTFATDYGWVNHVLFVTNNNDVVVGVTTHSTAYDKDGKEIGTSYGSNQALDPGNTGIIVELYETEEEVASYDTVVAAEESWYDCGVLNLNGEYTSEGVQNGLHLTIRNDGELPIQFVEAFVLFFNGEELVGMESAYLTDDDYEIKPGATIEKDVKMFSDTAFDDVIIGLQGYGEANTGTAE